MLIRQRREGESDGTDLSLIGVIIVVMRVTYSQMKTNNRLVGLPLFQMEEGILLSAFLGGGVNGAD